MDKIIFKNYIENINPQELKLELKKDENVLRCYNVCVNANKIKYGNSKIKYRLKLEAIQNQFIDRYIKKIYYDMQIKKGKICQSLLDYHKEKYKMINHFKKHFPQHYFLMFYYFTKSGIDRFPLEASKDYFQKTGKEPYSFKVENKILLNSK